MNRVLREVVNEMAELLTPEEIGRLGQVDPDLLSSFTRRVTSFRMSHLHSPAQLMAYSSLTSLVIDTIDLDVYTVDELLPPTLTDLTIRRGILLPEDYSRLPRGLLHLRTYSDEEFRGHEYPNLAEEIELGIMPLPTSLITLHIPLHLSSSTLVEFMDSLPNLTNLDLDMASEPAVIPDRIVDVKISTKYPSLSSLPASLTRLEWIADPEKIRVITTPLPLSIQYLILHHIDYQGYLGDHYLITFQHSGAVPSLRSTVRELRASRGGVIPSSVEVLEIGEDVSINHLHSLRELVIPGEVEYRLQASITKLSIGSIRPSYLQLPLVSLTSSDQVRERDLPRTLRTLSLPSVTVSAPRDLPPGLASLTVYNIGYSELHLTLPNLKELVVVEFSQLDRVQRLPLRLPRLEVLVCNPIRYSDVHKLPLSLTSLFTTLVDDEGGWVDEVELPLPPHLTYLSLNITSSVRYDRLPRRLVNWQTMDTIETGDELQTRIRRSTSLNYI